MFLNGNCIHLTYHKAKKDILWILWILWIDLQNKYKIIIYKLYWACICFCFAINVCKLHYLNLVSEKQLHSPKITQCNKDILMILNLVHIKVILYTYPMSTRQYSKLSTCKQTKNGKSTYFYNFYYLENPEKTVFTNSCLAQYIEFVILNKHSFSKNFCAHQINFVLQTWP